MCGFHMKKLRENPLALLRVGLGLVFLAAGLHRIFFFQLAVDNFAWLGLQPATALVIATIAIEFFVATCYLLERKVALASGTLIALLVVAVGISLLKAGASFTQNINELFVLTATPTNIFLHFTYLFCVVVVLLSVLGKKRQ